MDKTYIHRVCGEGLPAEEGGERAEAIVHTRALGEEEFLSEVEGNELIAPHDNEDGSSRT